MQSDHSYRPKETSLIQALDIWLSPVASEPQALVDCESSLLSALFPLIHLLPGENLTAVTESFPMAIKATRTKTVADFMLALAGLNAAINL